LTTSTTERKPPVMLGTVRRKFAASAITVAMLTAGNLFATASADAPSLSLFVGKDEIKVHRPGRRPAYFDPGVFLAATGGPLELRVTRLDYDHPFEINQIVQTDEGTEARPLPPESIDQFSGLKDFFSMEARNEKGKLLSTATLPFCPSAYDKQRVNDAGPAVPVYPSFCYMNPFTKSTVWGLEEGWAANASGFDGAMIDGADGHYDVTVSVAPTYAELFGIPAEAASATVGVTVKTSKNKCHHHCSGGVIPPGGGRVAKTQATEGDPVPTMENPDPSLLPDLVALPAWSVFVDRRSGGDYLSFAANVWVSGASPLVVEGFREPNADVMNGFQYFYQNGEAVGRWPAGELQYDNRRGHKHWHFKQFAAYSLLNADQTEAVKSKKEAFCLAPTDPIDLSLPGADWAPETGLSTACGSPNSIWIRETLPIGWGDTYYQGLPGQSFNVTDLPNGTYYIAVQANPLGALKEQDLSNNTQLREVILKGKPGHRRVSVPPWHGIDTEGGGLGPIVEG
jgi:Lysyl oxidase